jgi:hypothetical protein
MLPHRAWLDETLFHVEQSGASGAAGGPVGAAEPVTDRARSAHRTTHHLRLRISIIRFCRSLGEIPGTRAACPRVTGRIRASF